jgi:protein-disulfide isomerase/rhodanese-related sulfurtransferase
MRKTLALIFSFFGLFDAAYLWWVYTSPSHPLVCLGSGCDEVRASRFAFWGGIPTPAFGAVMYGVLVILLLLEPFAEPKVSALLRKFALGISAIGLLVSLYLTSVEAFQIHAWCAWCVTQQIAIAIIFVLLAMEVSRPAEEDPKRIHRTALQNVLVFVILLVAAVPSFAWLSHHSAAEEKKQLEGAASDAAPDLSKLIESDSHAIGPADAPLTVVEFGDFQCPSCIVAESTNATIRKDFPKQVRFIFRNFPLARFHQFAQKAAEAGECAADQGKFWQMHDRMYAADGELAVVQLKFYAQDIGLDTNKFNACLDSGASAARVEKDVADGKAVKITATPTFFINGERHVGGLKLDEFSAKVGATPAAPAPNPTATPAPAAAKPEAKVAAKPAAPAAEPAKQQPTQTASAATSIVPGLAPASNPLALGGAANSGDCDVNGTKSTKNEIPTSAAKDLLGKGATFVDIRAPRDFAKSHIKGAVNLPLNKLSDGVTALPKDKPVVVYESGLAKGDEVCAASHAAAGLIASRGYKDVKVYHDGFAGWQKAGAPVQ